MKKFFFSILTLAALLLLSLIFDRILGLLGFSAELKKQIVHPPNHEEYRKNIEFSYWFETNSQGLRYTEIPLNKGNGEFRVSVIGDSFVEGWGVDAKKTFCSFLERNFSNKHRQVRFINLGLSGTGPFQYGRALFGVGMKYEPDAVLICIYANDLSNTPAEDISYLIYPEAKAHRHGWRKLLHTLWPRMYILAKSASLKMRTCFWNDERGFISKIEEEARNREISEYDIERWKKNIRRDLVETVDKNHFNGVMLSYGLLWPNYWTDALDIETALAEQKWDVMSSILEKIIHGCRRISIKPAIVYFPSRFQYDPGIFIQLPQHPWISSGVMVKQSWLVGQAEIQKRLTKWTQKNNVPFYDLTPDLRNFVKTNQELTFPLDDHWTAKGHRLVGDLLYRWLQENYVFEIADSDSIVNSISSKMHSHMNYDSENH